MNGHVLVDDGVDRPFPGMSTTFYRAHCSCGGWDIASPNPSGVAHEHRYHVSEQPHHCVGSSGQLVDGVWRDTQVCACGWSTWGETGTKASVGLTLYVKRDLLAHITAARGAVSHA